MLNQLKSRTGAHPQWWVAVPLAIATGLAFFVGSARVIDDESHQRFEAYAQIARNSLVARIKSYLDLGSNTAALFRSRYPVTPLEFNSYVNSINVASKYPAVLAINFSEQVLDEHREQFLERLRATPQADGRIDRDVDIRPPGRRPEYTVATLIEPLATYRYMLGSDLTPLRTAMLARIRDEGKFGATGIPNHNLSTPNHAVLSMRVPTFLPGAPIDTVAQRRAAHTGSVGVMFSVTKLLAGVIGEMPVKHVRLTLIDRELTSDLAPSPVLFDSSYGSARSSAPPGRFGERFSSTLPIDFVGRNWEATFSVERDEMLSLVERAVPWLAMLAGFVGTLLVHALFTALTSSRKRAIKLARAMTRELRASQARLQTSHQRLRELAAHANQIKEEERKRIAREIHDDLGQNLLALRIEADILSNRTHHGHPRLHERARATLAQIDTTIRSVRHIINDLRPTVLDLGLSAAVEWQIAEFKRRTGIACDLVDLREEPILDERSSTALFRILQESLSNIVRHAHATHVRIELRMCGTALSMIVADNGVGLHVPERRRAGSFGLVGIEERMSILGGTFSFQSRPGMGTTVTVTVPMAPPQTCHARYAEIA